MDVNLNRSPSRLVKSNDLVYVAMVLLYGVAISTERLLKKEKLFHIFLKIIFFWSRNLADPRTFVGVEQSLSGFFYPSHIYERVLNLA